MQYEITQVLSYLVTAETPDEAMAKWADNPKTAIVEWKEDGIELSNEQVEINC